MERFSQEQLRRQAAKQGLVKLEEQYDIDLLEAIMKGKICPYCKQPTVFVDSIEVYRKKSYGMIYLCRPCQAWVSRSTGKAGKCRIERMEEESA